MKKQKFLVVQELDPESVEDIEQHKRDHFLSLGYKPYLLADGTVKWLTDAQRVYREAKTTPASLLPKFLPRGSRSLRRRHKHRSNFRKFLLEHWLFITMLAALVIGLWFMWLNWNIIF